MRDGFIPNILIYKEIWKGKVIIDDSIITRADMKLKDKMYDICVRTNEHVRYEYERYVREHIEEHRLQRWRHIRLLVKLNWFYRVKKSQPPYIFFDTMPKENNSANPDNRTAQVRDVDIVRNSLYFDEKWYKKVYPDVADMDPAEHYLTRGWVEYRSPGPSFSSLLYLNRYDDARNMGINPLIHYETVGKPEKRVSSYGGLYKNIKKDIEKIQKSIFWNEEWYKEKYLSQRFYIESPAVHYYCLGCYERKNPSPVFDEKLYEKFQPDVTAKPYPHLLHYENVGKFSGQGYFHQVTEYYNNTKLYSKILAQMNGILIDMISNNIPDTKRVLLITHLLNVTGAPKVLVKMAKILKKNGYYPVVATLHSGVLEKELANEEIPVILWAEYEDRGLSKGIVDFADLFCTILFNTVESLKMAHILAGTRANKICWVHEGQMTLDALAGKQIRRLGYMDQIYTCAEYCNKFFAGFVENKKLEVLHYGIEENDVLRFRKAEEEITSKFIITILGTVGYRKGHDILIDSIRYIPEDVFSQMELRVVGAIVDQSVGDRLAEICKEKSNVIYYGAVSNGEAIQIISESSLLVVPSRDDPMPVVITEAMILRKPVLMSTSVGTSSLVEDGTNAFIIKQNSPEGLAEEILRVFKEGLNLAEVGKRGYDVYRAYLSDESFEKKILAIFENSKEKIGYENNYDNTVQLTDAEMLSDGIRLIFVCALKNVLRIYSDCVFFEEDTYLYDEKKWVSLNAHLSKSQQRVAIIKITAKSLQGFQGLLISDYFDAVRLVFGQYVWSNLKWLSDNYELCIRVHDNLISFENKLQFKKYVEKTSSIAKSIKGLLKEVLAIQTHPYTIYVETRDNKNDNAYQLFRHDLLTSQLAYFVTTADVIANEQDVFLKSHYLLLNSEKSKQYMLRAKLIVCSWYQLQPFGYEKMQYIYPFLEFKYAFVPHGISYDKNSFYLNKSIWGRFATCVVSSQHEEKYFENLNGYSNVHVLGYPRMDKWMDKPIRNDEVLLFPTWRTEILQEYLDQLAELTKALNEYRLIYIAHPSIEYSDYQKICEMLKKSKSDVTCIHSKENIMFNQYFASARYLVTDYSSVAYDFAYKGGIPIYYEPFMNVEPNYELLPDFFENHCGIMAENSTELKMILKDERAAEKVNMRVKAFYRYIDANNTLRVFEHLREI